MAAPSPAGADAGRGAPTAEELRRALQYSLEDEEIPAYFRVRSLMVQLHTLYGGDEATRAYLLDELAIESGETRQFWFGDLMDRVGRLAYGPRGPATEFRDGGRTVVRWRDPEGTPTPLSEDERARRLARLYFELVAGLDEEGEKGLDRLQRLFASRGRLSSDEPLEGRRNPYWEAFERELERLGGGSGKEDR